MTIAKIKVEEVIKDLQRILQLVEEDDTELAHYLISDMIVEISLLQLIEEKTNDE